MPYATNSDLPDAVKNALPDSAQTIWRNAFNGTYGKTKDDSRAAAAGWAAIKNAGWAKKGDKWVKAHEYDLDELLLQYQAYHRARVKEPGAFQKGSFRTIDAEDGGGIKIVIGRLKGETDTTAQAYLFPIDKFSMDQVRAWLKEHDISYIRIDEGKKEQKITDVIRTHDFDAEVFSTGKWNGDPYTEKDLDNMVSAFGALKDSLKPPIKLGHDDKQKLTDGLPSMGWVTNLRRVGQKLIARLSEVPDIIYKAIRAGRYKRVSSEIFWNYKDATGKSYPRVLAGVALLGADLPAVTNLEDLGAFLTQNIPDGSFEKIATYDFEMDGSQHITTNIKPEGKQMSDEEKREYEAKIEAERKKAQTAEAELKTLKDANAAREKKEAEAKKEERTNAIKEFCDKAVKDGKMTPAYRDQVLKDMETGKYLYTHEAGFGPIMDMLKAFIDQGGVMKLEKEYTIQTEEKGAYDNPSEEMVKRAKKYMIDHPEMPYEKAVEAVCEADPKLGEAYKMD